MEKYVIVRSQGQPNKAHCLTGDRDVTQVNLEDSGFQIVPNGLDPLLKREGITTVTIVVIHQHAQASSGRTIRPEFYVPDASYEETIKAFEDNDFENLPFDQIPGGPTWVS